MATTIGTLVMLRLEARQREIITLSGGSGTATVSGVGGISKLATFATDLATTAKNFVTTHAAAYLAANIIVTASGGKLVFKPKLINTVMVSPLIGNASGDLAGTVVQVCAANSTINLIGELSTSLKSAATMIEISSKLTGNQSKFKPGRINQSLSVSSIASTDTGTSEYGYDDALQAQDQQVPIVFVVTEYDSEGDPVADAINIAGTTLISNVSIDEPDNDKSTFSLNLQINDDISVTVN
jgi:hypothetical protein